MLLQLLIGSIVIAITILVEVAFIFVGIRHLKRRNIKRIFGSEFIAAVTILTGITLWLIAAFSVATWVWALTFMLLGCFEYLEEAVYFSMVAFTSLGFGDITLPVQWRILSGPIAANGLILFGLNTAVLIETLRGLLKNSIFI